MIPDFEVLDSKNSECCEEANDVRLQEASPHGRAESTTGQSTPERKTNCLHNPRQLQYQWNRRTSSRLQQR